ncbi:MAG: glycosyltransferase family 4 protein [Pseudomonadales bacterium]|jgi:glycosyltransferase involved in cell wall biosynthesis
MTMRKGIKVAVIGPLPPPSGGMANQALQLVQLLERAGMEVNFVRVNAPYRPEWIADIKGLRALFRLAPYLYQLWRQIRASDLVHVLANSGWSWHLFAAPAIWIGWLLRKPVVINYRGGEAETFFKRAWRWVAPTVNKSRLVIVPSGFLQRIFARHGVPAQVVPNILDLARFDFADKKTCEGEALHFVVTRNLEKIYGVETVLQAFAMILERYPKARLTVAGSGPEENALKAQAVSLGIVSAVTFAGRLEPQQITELYCAADVLLNASIVDNSPNSLIEALAAGVPVVSSNVGGIPDLVEDGCSALLVPASQPQALARAVFELLENRSLREKLVLEGQQVAARFDQQNVLQKLEAVYGQAMDL